MNNEYEIPPHVYRTQADMTAWTKDAQLHQFWVSREEYDRLAAELAAEQQRSSSVLDALFKVVIAVAFALLGGIFYLAVKYMKDGGQ